MACRNIDPPIIHKITTNQGCVMDVPKTGSLLLLSIISSFALADETDNTFSSERVDVIKSGIETRQTRGRPPITVAIAIDAGTGLAYRAHRRGLEDQVMLIDEPSRRGGTNTGPAPLTYFVAGLGSCLLNQYIRLAVAWDLDLAFTGATVKGGFSRDVGGSFESFTQEILADGSASKDDIRRLTDSAGDYCYTHATLRQAVPMTTILQLNGTEVARTETRPEDFR